MLPSDTLHEVLVLGFPGQGNGGRDLIRKIMDPLHGAAAADFQLLSLLARTEMVQLQRHQSFTGFFPFPRRVPQRIMLQMNATQFMRDLVVDFLTGKIYIEPHIWSFIVTGGYVKIYEPINPSNIDNLLNAQPAPVSVVNEGIARYIPPHQDLNEFYAPHPIPQQPRQRGAEQEVRINEEIDNDQRSVDSTSSRGTSESPESPPYSPMSPVYSNSSVQSMAVNPVVRTTQRDEDAAGQVLEVPSMAPSRPNEYRQLSGIRPTLSYNGPYSFPAKRSQNGSGNR